MPKLVEYGESVIEFPDDASEADILEVLKAQSSSSAEQSSVPAAEALKEPHNYEPATPPVAGNRTPIFGPGLPIPYPTTAAAPPLPSPLSPEPFVAIPKAPPVEQVPPTAVEKGLLSGNLLGVGAEKLLGQEGAVQFGRSGVNLAGSLPEFLTSPLGITATAVGRVAPTLVAGAFAVDTLRKLPDAIADVAENWGEMTKPQKIDAITQLAGQTALGVGLGVHTVKGGLKAGERFAAKREAAAQAKTEPAGPGPIPEATPEEVAAVKAKIDELKKAEQPPVVVPVEQPAQPPVEQSTQPTPAKEVTPDAPKVQRQETLVEPQPSPAAKQPWEMTKDEFISTNKGIDEELVPVSSVSESRRQMALQNVTTTTPIESVLTGPKWYKLHPTERKTAALNAIRRLPNIPKEQSEIIADVASILPNRFWDGEISVTVGGEHPRSSQYPSKPRAAYGSMVRDLKTGELRPKNFVDDFYKPTVDVVALFNSRNPTDFFHEIGHRWQRRFLNESEHLYVTRIYEQSEQYQKWKNAVESNNASGQYRYSYEEWFANRFHDYLLKRAKGEVSGFSSKLAKVFEQFRQVLASIWNRVRKQSNSELNELLDKSLGVETRTTAPLTESGMDWFSMASDKFIEERHRFHVERALREGKPVPAEVLADYPDLKPSTPPARGTETTTASPVVETPPTTPPSEAGGGVETIQTPTEPFDYTRTEWNAQFKGKTSGIVKHALKHRDSVQMAIRAGIPVRPEVLADYPDLKPSPTAQPTASNDPQARQNVPSGQPQGTQPGNLSKPQTGGEAIESNRVVQEAQVEPKPEDIIGMGGARPEEFVPPPNSPIAIKNASIKELRDKMGLPDFETQARQTYGSVWDATMKLINDNGPQVVDHLIAELKQRPRALNNAYESAMLHHRMVDLRNEWAKAINELDKATQEGRLESLPDLKKNVQTWSDAVLDLTNITKSAGREWGRTGVARQMFAAEDFSLQGLELRKRMANDGRPLTQDEMVEIKRISDEWQKKNDELQKLLKEKEQKIAELEARNIIAEIKTKVEKTRPAGPITPVDLTLEIGKLTDKIRAKIEKNQSSDITPWVKQLAEKFWQQGIRELNPMIDALQGVLKEFIPGIDRQGTMDALSGRGHFTLPNPAPVKKAIRDLSQQARLVAHQIDIEARRPLPRTGPQRDVMSPEARREQQRLNELKRKFGVVITDPKAQLESALGAAKTMMRNRLADMKQEIATRERIVKSKTPLVPDAELAALKQEYAELKKDHDEIFPRQPLTPEQRIAAANRALDRSIEAVEAEIDAGGWTPRPNKAGTPETPELMEKRAWLAALREQRQELRDLDVVFRSSVVEKQLIDSIAEYERRIREGDLFSKESASMPDTPANAALRARREALAKRLAELRQAAPETKAQALAKAIEAAKAKGEELSKRINEGDIAARKKGLPSFTSPELESIRAENDQLFKILSTLQNEAKPKKTPAERALQAAKTRMTKRIAELQRRITESDYEPKPKKEKPLYDEEATKLLLDKQRLEKVFEHGLELDKIAKRTRLQRFGHGVLEVANAPRNFLSSWDVSAVLRQGGFISLAHPIRASKSIVPMFKAMFNENTARAIEAQIQHRENAQNGFYKAAGLYMAPMDSLKLSSMEEQMMSNLATSTGSKVKQNIYKYSGVAASNRAYITFLNKLRADSFDTMVKALTPGDRALTKPELEAIGNYINVATGRGKTIERASEVMATIFFSPRLMTSRIEMIAGQPFYRGSKLTRKAIAKDYAQFLLGLGTIVGLGVMAGGETSLDPTSAEFGKLKFGNTRVDFMAGLQQPSVLGAREFSGLVSGSKELFGKRTSTKADEDLWWRYIRTKFNPLVATSEDIRVRKNVVGGKITPTSVAVRLFAPISTGDLVKSLMEEGLSREAALDLLSFWGAGVSTYEKKPKVYY